nr:pentapeptide repeat-containing protein [uncultured Desulfobulbus sp.]
MRRLLIALPLLPLCIAPTSPGWSKSKMTPVEKNVQRLLKTKSCPGCDLSGADLRQCRLTKAKLNGANLSGAQLNLADLSGANLQQAILFETDLSGADLSFADLNGAEFRGTIFEGAHFKHTQLKGQSVNRLIHTEHSQLEVYEFAPPKELLIALKTPSASSASSAPSVASASPVPSVPSEAAPRPPLRQQVTQQPQYAKAAIKPAPARKHSPLKLKATRIAMEPLAEFTAPAAGVSDPKKIAALEKERKQQKRN